MISVIVPVYNVKPYLRKCLDSIIGQTYRDLEILIIDDGSTDGSGKICDEYKRDARVRVFHTENQGLSAARNRGLDEAQGEWIGFVDSDDWIDPDMYECLLRGAEEAEVDVVECGVYIEYKNKTIKRDRCALKTASVDEVRMLLKGEYSTIVMDKLWKRHCFSHLRFPINRVYEDIATTFRLFEIANGVCKIENYKYHYVRRNGSLSKVRDMKNLVGYWLSNLERYEYLKDRVAEEEKHILFTACIGAVARTWAFYLNCKREDRQAYSNEIIDMHNFIINNNVPIFGYRDWNIKIRIGAFFPHFLNPVSFWCAALLFEIFKRSLVVDYKLSKTKKF